MPRRDDDLAGEPGEELGEGFEVEPPAGRGEVLARLGEHLGEPVGLARGPLDQAVELAGGAVGDLAGLAPRVGQGTVAILLGPGDGLAAVAPRPRGVGERRGDRHRRRDPAEPDRADRDPQPLEVGPLLDGAEHPLGDLGAAGRQHVVDRAPGQGPGQGALGDRRQGRVDRAGGEQEGDRVEHAVLHDRLRRDQVQVAGQEVVGLGVGRLRQRRRLRVAGARRSASASGRA